jgi:hypothetical protein
VSLAPQADARRPLLDCLERILDLRVCVAGTDVSWPAVVRMQGGERESRVIPRRRREARLTWCSLPWGLKVELSLSYEFRCIVASEAFKLRQRDGSSKVEQRRRRHSLALEVEITARPRTGMRAP